MKLALFQTPNTDGPIVGTPLTEKYMDNHVRVSQWVDVDFPPLSTEERQAQLDKVATAREAATKYYETQLARINKQVEALQS